MRSITKQINILTFVTLTLGTLMTFACVAYAEETEVYYDAVLKTSSLGNYEVTVKAYERPSHEVLPIISSDYFPTSESKYKTEIDNTAPSATYKANTVTKVDVVFALGELSQTKQLEANIPNFENKLKNPANAFDLMVTSVETVTGGFDMADADSRKIFSEWEQYPYPNSFELTPDGKYLHNHGGNSAGFGIVLDGTRYNAKNSGGLQQAFVDPSSNSTGKLSMEAWLSPHPECGCGGGLILRWNKQTDQAYMLMVGELGRSNVIFCKVNNVSTLWGRLDSNSIMVTGAPVGGTELAKLMGAGGTAVYKVDISETGEIKLYKNGWLLTTIIDPNPITEGQCGLWAGCTIGIKDVSLAYETTVRKSLGDSISDVAWRDGSVRFIVHATDVIPDECLPGKEADFSYTVTKVLNSNAYLINLGTSINKLALEKLMNSILSADDTVKGFYYNNNPIYTGLDNSADKIINIAKNLSKPTDWVLVNTKLLWDTEYKDNERDVPLNFGEHDGTRKQPQDKSDITLASSWGLPLTHLYTDDKSLAEKWRYKHLPTFYDNSNIQAGFNHIWIVDPIESFEQPGKYRINYKRRDNPIYPNVNLADAFDNYRYWSTNYDRLDSK